MLLSDESAPSTEERARPTGRGARASVPDAGGATSSCSSDLNPDAVRGAQRRSISSLPGPLTIAACVERLSDPPSPAASCSATRRRLRHARARRACWPMTAAAAEPHRAPTRSPRSPPHFTPKAKRVIFLFMNGGPSHVDTFDPKPALAKHRRPEARPDRPATAAAPARAPPARRSSSASTARAGIEVSELFPEIGRVHRRPLRHPLDAHRHPEPRAAPAA